MRNILLIFKNSFLRNYISLFLAAAGVFILSLVLSSASELAKDSSSEADKIPVGLIDCDNSVLSDNFSEYLTTVLGMEVTEDNRDNLTDLLIKRQISAIIEVPVGFEEAAASGNVRNLGYTSLSDYENAAFIELYIQTYMSKTALLSQAANGDSEMFFRLLDESKADVSTTSAVDISKNIASEQKSSFTFFSGMFLMLCVAFVMVIALTIVDDKQFGTYSRMQLSPLNPIHYIVGTSLFGIVVGLIFALGGVAVVAVKGIDTGMPLWLVTLMFTLFTLFSAGFSLIVSLIVKNKAAVFVALFGLTSPLCILGGAWFPVDKDNIVLSKLAALTPHYWFMEAIRGFQANPDYNYLPSVAVLALFALLTYLAAAAIFARKQ